MPRPNSRAVPKPRKTPRALAAQSSTPTTSIVALVEGPSQISGARFTNVKPETVSAMKAESARGNFDRWFDFLDDVLESDAHLASLQETRNTLLVGSPMQMKAGKCKPEEQALANEAAHFCQEELERVTALNQIFGDLNFARFSGLSAYEHRWTFERGGWASYPEWRAARIFRLHGRDWKVEVRDRERKWIDLPPAKFIVHMTRSRSTYPTKGALAREILWEWCFKYWATFFWNLGAERSANRPMIGKVSGKVDGRVREALRLGLQFLSSGAPAILEENTGIEFPDTGFATSADVWERLVKTLEAAQSKRIVGSTLNVEVGETGGAYAAADSQAVTTMRPRILTDGDLLGDTIQRDWCACLLYFNSHRFGGRVPPVPRPVWDPEVGKEPIADPVLNKLVETGSIRRNELRAQARLGKLTAAEGGEDFVTAAPAPAAPAAAPTTASEEGRPGRPFSRAASTPRSTSPTSSPSRGRANPLERALSSTSADPPR